MGSLDEFKQAIKFASEKKIIPTVHQTYSSLDKADDALVALKEGTQFGKLVILIDGSGSGQSTSRL